MELPPDEIMRHMAQMAMENAAIFFAKMADDFSKELDPNTSGPDALKAFARAIRSTNRELYPTGTKHG
jgi:hypothetical protein